MGCGGKPPAIRSTEQSTGSSALKRTQVPTQAPTASSLLQQACCSWCPRYLPRTKNHALLTAHQQHQTLELISYLWKQVLHTENSHAHGQDPPEEAGSSTVPDMTPTLGYGVYKVHHVQSQYRSAEGFTLVAFGTHTHSGHTVVQCD